MALPDDELPEVHRLRIEHEDLARTLLDAELRIEQLERENVGLRGGLEGIVEVTELNRTRSALLCRRVALVALGRAPEVDDDAPPPH